MGCASSNENEVGDRKEKEASTFTIDGPASSFSKSVPLAGHNGVRKSKYQKPTTTSHVTPYVPQLFVPMGIAGKPPQHSPAQGAWAHPGRVQPQVEGHQDLSPSGSLTFIQNQITQTSFGPEFHSQQGSDAWASSSNLSGTGSLSPRCTPGRVGSGCAILQVEEECKLIREAEKAMRRQSKGQVVSEPGARQGQQERAAQTRIAQLWAQQHEHDATTARIEETYALRISGGGISQDPNVIPEENDEELELEKARQPNAHSVMQWVSGVE